MKEYILNNEDVINLNNEALVVKGNAKNVVINVSENTLSNIAFYDCNIENLQINLLANSTLKWDSYSFSLKKNNIEINIEANAALTYKYIGAHSLEENLNVNLKGYNSNIVANYLALNKDCDSTVKQYINHEAQSSKSNINNYVIALDNANLNFDTIGKINKGMSKSVCKQLCRGINVGFNSSIKSEPILLIDEYDVSANHGCAIGKMSDDELFYLMSRGLSKTEAFKMILSGIINPFFDDLLLNDIKDELENSLYKLI